MAQDPEGEQEEPQPAEGPVNTSHELDTVERVSSRIVILHRGKIVADDSIAKLRSLMELESLEAIFSQLAVEQDSNAMAREIADLIHA